MLSVDVFRHASNGPTPVKNSSRNPSGMFTLLKNGAPTLIREPLRYSEKTGKTVPETTATHATSTTKLLKRTRASRHPIESHSFSLFTQPRLLQYTITHTLLPLHQ